MIPNDHWTLGLDALGMDGTARRLARLILQCQPPYAIAVQGKWGSGNRSLEERRKEGMPVWDRQEELEVLPAVAFQAQVGGTQRKGRRRDRRLQWSLEELGRAVEQGMLHRFEDPAAMAEGLANAQQRSRAAEEWQEVLDSPFSPVPLLEAALTVEWNVVDFSPGASVDRLAKDLRQILSKAER